ncbi:hypothetical protein EYF80_060983 [Liparis tanakae]|uniref:Uncharacterized protein n=1 Tax=Liparis tanakae TaxID=230148 RepID=A0A4Z2EJC0_9TELE|nr:hypothetical protein EYF80_060983 [Liparis tanakae]
MGRPEVTEVTETTTWKDSEAKDVSREQTLLSLNPLGKEEDPPGPEVTRGHGGHGGHGASLWFQDLVFFLTWEQITMR